MIRALSVTLALWLGGCATSFTGSAYVEDGRAGCERKCQADGLQMSGIVYMGEYSSACVCELKKTEGGEAASSSAGASAATVGVIMNMREEERRNDDGLMSINSLH